MVFHTYASVATKTHSRHVLVEIRYDADEEYAIL